MKKILLPFLALLLALPSPAARRTIDRLEAKEEFRVPQESDCSNLTRQREGDWCIDTTKNMLMLYNGSSWEIAERAIIACPEDPPTSACEEGQACVDDTNLVYYRCDDTASWVVIGATGSSDGDVTGPTSATDNALARFNGTTGKTIQDYTSGAPTVSDTGAVTVPSTLDVTGATTLSSTLGVTGATTLSSTLDTSGASTLQGALTLHDGTDTDYAITVDQGAGTDPTITWDDSAGNLLVADGGFVENGCSDVASATTITVDGCNYVTITGSTQIDTINTCDSANTGRRLVVFCGSATATLSAAGNLNIGSGHTCASSAGLLSLICDGTNWLELERQ